MIDFAYSRLNLRFNPFGEFDRQQKIDCSIPKIDLQPIVDFMASDTDEPRAVQFLGSQGSGKTTHLWLLSSLLHDFHYLHIPEGTTRSLPDRAHLMIDEAQRMTWWQRRTSFRKVHRLILGTHRCYDTLLRRQGFNTMTVQLDKPPETEWLARVLERKIDFAVRRPAGVDLAFTTAEIIKLRDQYGHNIRRIERHLYEVIQDQISTERISKTERLRP